MKIEKDISHRMRWYSVALKKKQNIKEFSQYYYFKIVDSYWKFKPEVTFKQ